MSTLTIYIDFTELYNGPETDIPVPRLRSGLGLALSTSAGGRTLFHTVIPKGPFSQVYAAISIYCRPIDSPTDSDVKNRMLNPLACPSAALSREHDMYLPL